MMRIFPLLLAGMLLLTLSACGSTTSVPDRVSSTESSTAQFPEVDLDAAQSSSNTVEQETVTPNSDSNILIAYFSMPEDVDCTYPWHSQGRSHERKCRGRSCFSDAQ